jgi:5-methylthioadenosine/S-adenosylhomocysteine deaminase
MKASRKWMLKGGLVLAHAAHKAARMDIVVDHDTIVAVGERLDPGAFDVSEIHSAQGRLIVPGFINTHYHSHDRWDRGRFSPLPLEIWMSLYNPPTAGRAWTPEEIYLRTLVGGLELMRGGTTSVMDDVHLGLQLDDASIDAVFRAYSDLGLRADVGVAYSDRPGHMTIPYLDDVLPKELKTRGQSSVVSTDEMLGIWETLCQKWNSRVRAVVSVSGPQRCTDLFQQDAWTLADRFNRPVLTHVLESRVQALTGPHFYGKSLVAHMDDIGVLRPNSVLIHGVWMSHEDLDLVARGGACVSHNPVSNLKLGSGIAPIIEMLERGIPVGLGTDNHNGNDGCSMFEAVKLAVMLQTTQTDDYRRWPSAEKGIAAATANGARLMGRDGEIGRIEAGFKADLLVFDLSADAFLPLNDAAVHLVFADASRALRDVYVDGQRVMENETVLTVDEPAIRQEVAGRIESIQKKVLDGVPKARELEPYLLEAYDKCLRDQFMVPLRGRCNCCPSEGYVSQRIKR